MTAMKMTRRAMLAAVASGMPAFPLFGAEPGKKRLGIVIHSYGIRSAADRARDPGTGINDPIRLLERCHRFGAGGIQTNVGRRDKEYVTVLRRKLDAYQMYLEGSVRLPQEKADGDRFAREVETAKEAGATVVRTVMLGGRRYETFGSVEAFRKWAHQAYESLGLAEPIVARQEMRLAVENHKDLRSDELIDILKRLSSRHVGACVDTGNSIALLEQPSETVEALAPWAMSVHLKDMAVAEYEDGFLLSEVPLGDGLLDLSKIVATLRNAQPRLQFSLEMITRDPLKVACLTPKYWATFENLSGRHLAKALAMVRKNKPRQPLPRVSGLSQKRQLEVEEENVLRSLAYAGKELEL